MATKDKVYEQHVAEQSLDRPKEFGVSATLSTQDYVRFWCMKNGLKHDAETERLKKAERKKRIAGPKKKLP